VCVWAVCTNIIVPSLVILLQDLISDFSVQDLLLCGKLPSSELKMTACNGSETCRNLHGSFNPLMYTGYYICQLG
jgi:hypothetical protein